MLLSAILWDLLEVFPRSGLRGTARPAHPHHPSPDLAKYSVLLVPWAAFTCTSPGHLAECHIPFAVGALSFLGGQNNHLGQTITWSKPSCCREDSLKWPLVLMGL